MVFAESVILASQRVKDRFGDRITLEYLDLSVPICNRRSLELPRGIKNKELLLPLLLVNGEPRITGQLDIYLLQDAVSIKLELNYEQKT